MAMAGMGMVPCFSSSEQQVLEALENADAYEEILDDFVSAALEADDGAGKAEVHSQSVSLHGVVARLMWLCCSMYRYFLHRESLRGVNEAGRAVCPLYGVSPGQAAGLTEGNLGSPAWSEESFYCRNDPASRGMVEAFD